LKAGGRAPGWQASCFDHRHSPAAVSFGDSFFTDLHRRVGISNSDGGAMRVLVVDDESSILLFISTVLREAGYDTVIAQDGEDALNKRGSFDLLLTDVMMPRMRGEALAARMRKRDPTIPVLYLTAYSDHLFERKLVLDEGEAFLDKPVTASALLEAIEMLLYGHRLSSV
jgi:CheY-like chemotaxis protein